MKSSSPLHYTLIIRDDKHQTIQPISSFTTGDYQDLLSILYSQHDPFQHHKPCTLQMVSAQLPCLYRVIDQHTKAIIKSNLSLRAAYRLCDRLDMQSGATRYFSQRME